MSIEQRTSIIIQIGPSNDIKSIANEKIGYMMLQQEANMVIKFLSSEGILPPSGKFQVSFKNDDLGPEAEYPFIKVGDCCYDIELLNNC